MTTAIVISIIAIVISLASIVVTMWTAGTWAQLQEVVKELEQLNALARPGSASNAHRPAPSPTLQSHLLAHMRESKER